MEKFFNLRFIKYPISFLIILILMGFVESLSPTAIKDTKAEEKNSGFMALDMNIPSSNNAIDGKDISNDNTDTSSSFQEMTFVDVERKEPVKTEEKEMKKVENINRKMDVISRTYVPNNNQPGYNYSGSSVNGNTYKKSYDNKIQQLEERIRQMDNEKKGINLDSNKVNIKKSNPEDLVYKKEAEALLTEVFTEKPENAFFTNGQRKSASKSYMKQNYLGSASQALSVNTKKVKLLTGKLVENKTVRNGSSIKIMLTESNPYYGLENGDMLAGTANIQGDRLYIIISGFIKDGEFSKIDGQVMDLDGLVGMKVTNDANQELKRQTWGRGAGNALGSVNPLLVYQPTGNLGTTVANQVAGSLINQSLNGVNQFANAKMADVKIAIKTGQKLYIFINSQN